MDPRVFVGVAERLAEARGHGGYRPYRDDANIPMNQSSNETARPTSIPRYESGARGAQGDTEPTPEKGVARGGGMPTAGTGNGSMRAGGAGASQDVLDLISMDMNSGGNGELVFTCTLSACRRKEFSQSDLWQLEKLLRLG